MEYFEARLSLMKNNHTIVAIRKKTDNRTVVVRWYADLRQWVTLAENSDGYAMLGSHKTFSDDDKLIDYMAFHGGIGTWEMRQQTGNGRFDTILTQHWNDGSSPERLVFNDAMQARLNSLIYGQWIEYDNATHAENWKFASHEYGMIIWHTDPKSSGVYARCTVLDGLDILWGVCPDVNLWLLKQQVKP